MDPFWSTFVATVAGALVGVAGAWLIFGLESRERYSARLNQALSEVVAAIPPHLQSMDAVEGQVREDRRAPSWPAVERRWPPGDRIGLALIAASMVARGEDRKVVDAARSAFESIARLPSDRERGGLLMIATMLGDWRSGKTKGLAATFARLAEEAPIDPTVIPSSPWSPNG